MTSSLTRVSFTSFLPSILHFSFSSFSSSLLLNLPLSHEPFPSSLSYHSLSSSHRSCSSAFSFQNTVPSLSGRSPPPSFCLLFLSCIRKCLSLSFIFCFHSLLWSDSWFFLSAHSYIHHIYSVCTFFDQIKWQLPETERKGREESLDGFSSFFCLCWTSRKEGCRKSEKKKTVRESREERSGEEGKACSHYYTIFGAGSEYKLFFPPSIFLSCFPFLFLSHPNFPLSLSLSLSFQLFSFSLSPCPGWNWLHRFPRALTLSLCKHTLPFPSKREREREREMRMLLCFLPLLMLFDSEWGGKKRPFAKISRKFFQSILLRKVLFLLLPLQSPFLDKRKKERNSKLSNLPFIVLYFYDPWWSRTVLRPKTVLSKLANIFPFFPYFCYLPLLLLFERERESFPLSTIWLHLPHLILLSSLERGSNFPCSTPLWYFVLAVTHEPILNVSTNFSEKILETVPELSFR